MKTPLQNTEKNYQMQYNLLYFYDKKMATMT